MKSGTLFDNVLITDDPEYAKQLAEETWGKHKDVSLKFPPIFESIEETVRLEVISDWSIDYAGWEGSIWWGREEDSGGGTLFVHILCLSL